MRTLIRLSCFATVLLLTACFNQQPQDVANRYWNAVLSGDTDTLRDVAAQNSQSNVNRISQPDDGSNVSFGKTTIEDDEATVETTVHWLDGDSTMDIRLQTALVNEEGKWKVDIIKTRRSLYAGLFNNAFSSLSDSIEEGATALQRMGKDIADDVNREVLKAGKELQKQTEQASKELEEMLDELEQELDEPSGG